MLAGRKLLLADDSVTVQKVIDLTFADEGVEVIIAGDGEEAIEKVEELLPDVVLVDVFMPVFNGYEVCEFIKTSEKLKHIPVMLLVGSFEPFDEAEARRVGANDILTKPFKSIRRLIDKVGELVHKPDSEGPTAELPAQHEEPNEPRLSTEELEITTADTMQLPAELAPVVELQLEDVATEESFSERQLSERQIESSPSRVEVNQVAEQSDVLLDLDLETVEVVEAEDFELELDLDEVEATPAPAPFAAPALADTEVSVSAAGWEASAKKAVVPEAISAPIVEEAVARVQAPVRSAIQATVSQELSPEMIDTIARRAVEYLSEKVIREIAWEVVPQLADLLIRRQLEERESQPK